MRARLGGLLVVVVLLVACRTSEVRNEGAVGELPPPPTPESTRVPRADSPGPIVDVFDSSGRSDALPWRKTVRLVEPSVISPVTSER